MKIKNKHLHIAHVVDLRVVGGIERILVEFVLAAPHVNHSLILFDKHIHPSLLKSLQNVPQLTNTMSTKHWHGLRIPKFWRPARRSKLIQQAGADVVLNWSQVFDARSIKKPVVFYEHGSSWEHYSSEQMQQCYAGVHHAIAVSQAAKRMLQLHHHFEQPCEVIHNTVLKSPTLINHKRSLENHCITLGSAGRLVARKNFAVLIEAVSILNKQYDVQLMIAGTGPEHDSLQELIKKYRLEEKVTLMGHVSQMDKFYKNIDVFVNASLWEAMPMVAIESFAAGVPIIGTATDGLPEIVVNGVNGICIQPRWSAAEFQKNMLLPATFLQDVSYNPDTDALEAQKSLTVMDLVSAIESLMNNPKHYREMSEAALQAAKSIKPFAQLVDEVLISIQKAIP